MQVDLAEGRRYRVQVGQFMMEAEAQAASARLDRKFNLQSFVVRDDG
jgi:rare lipoprotein A